MEKRILMAFEFFLSLNDMYLRRQLDQCIGDCLNELGRFWMFTPTIQAADDLELVSDDWLESRNIHIWAAALVYAIARHNKLTSNDLAISISLENVVDFFGTTEEIVLTHASLVDSYLNLTGHPERYAEFDFPQLDTEFNSDSTELMDEGIVVASFQSLKQITPEFLAELEDLVWQELDFFNEDEPEELHLELISVRAQGRILELELEGYLEDVDLFCYQLEENDLELVEIKSLEEYEENRYRPSSHYTAFMEQYETMGLDHLNFENLDDLEAFMDGIIGKSVEELGSLSSSRPEGKALIEAIRAFDLPVDESINVSKRLLKKFPRCIEAYICLAGWQSERKERIKILKKALKEGGKDLDFLEIDKQKIWWLDHRTRPYMRAFRFLAEEYIEDAHWKKGCTMLWQMLEMDESDHLSNRMLLLEVSIMEKQWSSVEKLFKLFPKEDSLIFHYGKVVYLYHSLGRHKKTKNALLKAYKRNRFPLRLVAGLEEYPDQQPFFTPGDKLEATTVIDFLLACFGEDQNLAEFFIQELYDVGAWEVEYPNFNIKEDQFVSIAKIIPLDRRSDN
ncbi:MAG: hypothetical protein KDC53_23310 [Saprospiraceae bacterium]|nr:hypothetical protein [Saprospiraceae bacterium]